MNSVQTDLFLQVTGIMKRCPLTMVAGGMAKNSIIQPEQTILMFPAEH
jgi:hypothetical protein